MPKGEFNESKNADRVSAIPSPSVSRSSVIRLALGTAAPACYMNRLTNHALMPLPSLGRTGTFVSATNTSPFFARQALAWLA
jgi:hypothetical protein